MSVNIALLGSGLFASNAYIPALFAQENKHINLHTVWSRSQVSAEKVVKEAKAKGGNPKLLFGNDGLETVLADKEIDGVMMVLPITTQTELLPKIWKAGKHVMMEKPMAKDVITGKGLIETFEKEYKPKGLLWRIAEDWDHETFLDRAAEVIRDPAVGPVLYWTALNQTCVIDGSAYQSTEWRTIPDYQGGFILDGGVHAAAMIRNVLPNPPETIISTANLHRNHIPPHDTVIALALPDAKSVTEPHGPPTKLKGLRTNDEIPGTGIGKSSANGTIVFSWAVPDIPADQKAPGGMEITCLNAVVKVQMVAGKWQLTVIPANGSSVKALKEQADKAGVKNECGMFARAIQAVKSGKKPDEKEDRGKPIKALWDVALIEAMLKSNGEKLSMSKLVETGK